MELPKNIALITIKEYNELRDFKSNVLDNKICVSYRDWHDEHVVKFYTENELIKLNTKKLNDLEKQLNDLKKMTKRQFRKWRDQYFIF